MLLKIKSKPLQIIKIGIFNYDKTSSLLEAYFFSKKYLKPKGWFESRYLHKPVNRNGNPIPWMTYSSIHFINEKLKLKPMSVFEYGSGNSTLWFASRVENIISIENDAVFYNKMIKKVNSIGNVSYELRNLNDNYSSEILEYENAFDVLIIDGRERVQCAKNCIKSLKKEGVIIFDNSDRIKYKEAGPISHIEWKTTIYYRENNCFEI